MSAHSDRVPRLIHALPGRARFHLVGWLDHERAAIEARLSKAPGVSSVRANPLTGNVLVRFDPRMTDARMILAVLKDLSSNPDTGPRDNPSGRAAVTHPQAPAGPLAPRLHGITERSRALTVVDERPTLSTERGRSTGDIIHMLGGLSGMIDIGVCLVNLALSGSVLGLISNGAQILRLWNGVHARRAERRRYEDWPRHIHEQCYHEQRYVICIDLPQEWPAHPARPLLATEALPLTHTLS